MDVVEYSSTSHSDGKYENLSGISSKYKSNVVAPTPERTLNSLLYLLFSKIIVELFLTSTSEVLMYPDFSVLYANEIGELLSE